jgi:hypothetical protein
MTETWGQKQLLCVQALKEILVYIELMIHYSPRDLFLAGHSFASNLFYSNECIQAVFQVPFAY